MDTTELEQPTAIANGAANKQLGRLRNFGTDIEPRYQQWIWYDRLAAGVSAIVGIGGRGKSMLTLWLTAHLTNGTLPGSLEGRKVAVIIASAEDPSEEIVWARLEAVGANRNHVNEFTIAGSDPSLPGSFIRIPDELAALEEKVRYLKDEHNYDNVVVFIDPLRGHLSTELDNRQDHIVRAGVVDKLILSTKRVGYDIILVDHLNKQSNQASTDQRMIGAGWYNAFRTILVFGREPGTEPHENRRAIAMGKNNWGEGTTALIAEVRKKTVTHGKKKFKTSFLEIIGEDPSISAEAIIEADSPKVGRSGGITKRKLAALGLIAALSNRPPEGLPATLAKQSAMSTSSCSMDTVDRAAADVGVVKHQYPDGSGNWYWRLPTDAEGEF